MPGELDRREAGTQDLAEKMTRIPMQHFGDSHGPSVAMGRLPVAQTQF